MQPILSLRAPTESLNCEMLLRMRDTDGSIVPPGQIISAAQNSGRITLIDRWVLGATLAWLERNKEPDGSLETTVERQTEACGVRPRTIRARRW